MPQEEQRRTICDSKSLFYGIQEVENDLSEKNEVPSFQKT